MFVPGDRTGEISYRPSHEWTVGDIFSYTAEDVCRYSPSFDAWGSRWYLRINPNGETRNNSVGWVCLFLFREEASSAPQRASYVLGVKRVDGTVGNLTDEITRVFDEKGEGYGPRLMRTSELLRRRSELAPSDALTVTCSLLSVDVDLRPSRSLDTLSKNLTDMFTSKRGCDVALKVKQVEFPVHKFVLSARSPVFAAMFESDMKERQTGVVDIVDCDPVAFKHFLTYLYSGRAENLPGNAFELYRIADKYGVIDLKPACLVSIMRGLTVENALDAVILADEFSEDELKLKTQDFFHENLDEIFSTARWESFMKSNSRLANQLLRNMASKIKLKK